MTPGEKGLAMSDDFNAPASTEKPRFEWPAGGPADAVIAYTTLRISFGINFMLHGCSRLLADHANFEAYVNHYFEHTPLMPRAALVAFSRLPCLQLKQR